MSKIDVLLKKATSFEKLALYSDRSVFLQAIAQGIQQFPPTSGLGVNAPYLPETAPPVKLDAESPPPPNLPPPPLPSDVESPSPPNLPLPPAPVGQRAVGYPSVPQSVQEALNTLMGMQLKIDGKLGPETRKALNNFKTTYNVPSDTSDQELFQTIKYHTNR